MASESHFHSETYHVLNSLTDNVFLADPELRLIWMNEAAEELMKDFYELFSITSAAELLGRRVSDLHPSHSSYHHVMAKGDIFPHETRIKLFDKYIANIVVNKLTDDQGQLLGYILFWQDITKQEEARDLDQKLIDELSTPILPSVLQNTLFVPLLGTFNEKRIDHLTHKLLQEVLKNNADYIVFDMSGMVVIDNEDIAERLYQVVETVTLMGAKVFFAGFLKEHVKKFVKFNTKYKLSTFPHYRQAIQHVMSLEGYEIVRKTDH
ncbi:hypothetical protein CR194_10430 [Salipaludibacillus keqinensis]|jgi:rsbT co-antagonist protein RsbR|uniref:PAS domain-containing protein n=1 Tax=Salipaludibacillus keqinensis TaxID=2045207 RepID=A0A323TF09_9BACI|nr:PAS domain-containing protein [Salipaludibacillus keqinensis]PYZ93571.1 hypothetical protein CR194_10430 [Salipaludibacillus keqinensis]